MRGALWGMLGLSAGCGLAAPSVSGLRVEVEPCGDWRATVDASGLGQEVRADVDGALVGAWTVWGTSTYAFSGRTPPGERAEVRVRVGDSLVVQLVDVPDVTWTWTPEITPLRVYAGDRAVVGGRVVPRCPVADARYLARVGDAEVRGPLAGDGGVRVDVGPLAEGWTEVRLWVEHGERSQELPPLRVEAPPAPVDRDGDGYVGDEDCDETRAEVNAGALEAPVPNGRDDDCDGVVDEGTVAFDDDGDGLSERDGDCDDTDPGRRPGAAELPDCRDQDCDGEIDEGVTRPEVDDPDEPNDDRHRATDLHTGGQRAFSRELELMVRDGSDAAWWSFYSQDGDFDAWGIVATVARMADGAVVDLVLVDDAGTEVGRQRVTAEGQQLHVTGRPLRDDSGIYRLGFVPVRQPLPWCPARVSLVSR